MECRVCGEEKGTEYRFAKRQALCPACDRETPRKLSFETFNDEYFGITGSYVVDKATRRDFYDDYLASTLTMEQYIRKTRGYERFHAVK